MTIKIGNKNYTLNFTFNSFKHLKDFDISEMETVEKYPFRMFAILSTLFHAALNFSPAKTFTLEESDELLEKYLETADMQEFTASIMQLLYDTGFFKNHQK